MWEASREAVPTLTGALFTAVVIAGIPEAWGWPLTTCFPQRAPREDYWAARATTDGPLHTGKQLNKLRNQQRTRDGRTGEKRAEFKNVRVADVTGWVSKRL